MILGIETISKMSDNINSKLWWAAWNGEEALVSQLIEEGAEVDWRDDQYNKTALHKAANKGRLQKKKKKKLTFVNSGFTPPPPPIF